MPIEESSRGVGELRSLNSTIFEAMPIEDKALNAN